MNFNIGKTGKALRVFFLPGILLIFPLIKISYGLNLADTTYSLANYENFMQMEGYWKYATYLANAVGYMFVQLTQGKMIFLNLITALIISAIGLIAYFKLSNEDNYILVFLGELVALSLCWCPNVILYNTLTYLLLTVATLVLYSGLTNDKKLYMFIAGVLLGINALVRMSNIIECVLIVAVWFYCYLKQGYIRESQDEESANDNEALVYTLLCIGGFLVGIAASVLLVISLEGTTGLQSAFDWITSLLNGGDDNGGYSIAYMVNEVVNSYLGNALWFLMTIGAVLLGIVGFKILENKLVILKKIFFTIAVLVLIVYFNRNGIFDLYYKNTGAVFRLSVVIMLWQMIILAANAFGKFNSHKERTLYLMALIILLISPLGTNNHLYAAMNNMFLVMPVFVLGICRLINRYKDRNWIFAPKCVIILLFGVFLIQSVLFHANYVFRDGEDGTPLDTVIKDNPYVEGIITSRTNADCVEGLSGFFPDCEYILAYGNIPGVNYIIGAKPALSNIWPDLDSYSYEEYASDMEQLPDNTVIVVTPTIYDTMISGSIDEPKLELLNDVIISRDYYMSYRDDEFVIFQKEIK